MKVRMKNTSLDRCTTHIYGKGDFYCEPPHSSVPLVQGEEYAPGFMFLNYINWVPTTRAGFLAIHM